MIPDEKESKKHQISVTMLATLAAAGLLAEAFLKRMLRRRT